MTFPAVILPVSSALQFGGTWNDVTTYVYTRGGDANPKITRGRTDQSSTASAQSLNCQLNNRDGRFSPRNPVGPYYGSMPVRNCPMRIGITTPNKYLRLADDLVSFASTPGTGAKLFATSIDIRWFGKLDNHNASVLASNWTGSARSWAFVLNPDGTLSFYWSTTGSDVNSVQSTPGLPVPLGSVVLRVTANTSNNQVQFFTGYTMAQPLGNQWGNTIIGGPSALNITGSGQVLQVGACATLLADIGYNGFQGRCFEFQLLNGIAGTTEADAVFTSQTVGATSFTDAQSNVWTVNNGTAEISATNYRFHGEIQSLPQQWDNTGNDVWSPLTAYGVIRRIQQQQKPLYSSMRRAILQQAGLEAYWPFEDPFGSTQAASGLRTGTGYPMIIQNGTPFFANDSSFQCSAPLMQINNSQMQGFVQQYIASTTMTIRGLVSPIAALLHCEMAFITNGIMGLMQFTFTNGVGFQLFINGALFATCAVGTPGQQYMFSIELVTSGGNVTPTLRIMDINGNITSSAGAAQAGSIGTIRYAAVNGGNLGSLNPAANPGITTIGHVYVQSAATIVGLATMLSAFQAHVGEAAGNRFIRLCQENGLNYRVYGYPNLTVAMGAQTVTTLMSLMQECESADMGLIFDSKNAFAVGYRTGKSLQSQGAASNNLNGPLVLNYAAAHIGDGTSASLNPTDDDTYLLNDVLATRGTASGLASTVGSFYEAVLNDGSPMSVSPPPVGSGTYDTSVTVNVQNDNQVRDAAGWMLHIGTDNEERIPNVPLNPARTELASLIWNIADLDIGDYEQIQNGPTFLPPGPIKLLLFGYDETFGNYTWAIQQNTVPEAPFETAIVGDAILGRVGTDGSVLNAGLTTTQTSFDVNPANSSVPLWTTTPVGTPWIKTAQGTPSGFAGVASGTYFTLLQADATAVSVGDYLIDQNNPGTIFQVTQIDPPAFGFNNIRIIPSPSTNLMSNPEIVTQVNAGFAIFIIVGGELMLVKDINGGPANFLTGDNATFDASVGNWTNFLNDTVARVASPTYTGPGSMQMLSSAAGDMQAASCTAGNIATQGMACAANDVISLAAWLQANATGRSVAVGANFYTAANAFISTLFATASADVTTGYTKVTGTVTAPATSAHCSMNIKVTATAASNEAHYVDCAYMADITSGVAGRQTFVVVRSLNGIVKTHSAGETVALANPAILSIK